VWIATRDGLQAVLIGLAVGVGVAIVAARLLQGQIYGLGGVTPGLLVPPVIALAFAGAVAAILPVRRVLRIQPTEALRSD
jgi:ABC-type antimicrobial peptide transport system permease subunit